MIHIRYVYGKPDVPKASYEITSQVYSELADLQERGDWDAAVQLVVKAGDPKAQSLASNDWYRLRRSLEIIKVRLLNYESVISPNSVSICFLLFWLVMCLCLTFSVSQLNNLTLFNDSPVEHHHLLFTYLTIHSGRKLIRVWKRGALKSILPLNLRKLSQMI